MLKRILLIFCILMMLIPVSSAESSYSDSDSVYKFISAGDIGFPIEKLLNGIGFFAVDFTEDKDNPKPYMSEAACEALIEYQIDRGLDATGIFDPQTVCMITGAIAADGGDLVWIPMHGGKKHHNNEDCSNMIEPRQMPKECALKLEFGACKKCY